jgi:hypothetical protein
VADRKRQHVIPKCYLKVWCDPRTPAGQQPYIWRVSRDGSTTQRRSPEKSFTENDRYTIKLPNGDRDLTLENTLGGIESDFIRVLTRIRRQRPLNAVDRAKLCAFTAAMHTRTIAMGDHWKRFEQEVHEKVVTLEKQHNAPPITSLETAEMAEHAHQYLVATGIEVQAPMLFAMRLTIMVTDDELGFITSDTPCVWFNPEWYKLPPFYRSPGLGQPQIEVTLPLSPQHLLWISHNPRFPLYQNVGQKTVDEVNRRTRFHCNEEFVSWKGETRPYWFDPGKKPDDCWENTEQGRLALAQEAECNRWRKESEQQKSTEAANALSDSGGSEGR